MTHLIIPINYMQAAINAKKAEIIHSEALKDSIRAGIENYELKILEDLLNTSKQISLYEKDIDIEQKAIDNSDYCKDKSNHGFDCGCGDYEKGYKQAFKDLLSKT